ncbi:hypothetical protein [Pedobacter westerhofensis]|nr:hypothetical protein [Pedobacter westerhofensis]
MNEFIRDKYHSHQMFSMATIGCIGTEVFLSAFDYTRSEVPGLCAFVN